MDYRPQLEAAARHIFAGREPCEYDFMRVVPSCERTRPLPGRCYLHGLPVGSGRRTTCCRECGEAMQRLVFWVTMCRSAWERDDGRCQECGAELVSVQRLRDGTEYRHPSGATFHHVVEVREGGGQLGRDNIVTLCQPCHDAKTAEYAAKRAAAKRDAMPKTASPQLQLLCVP